MRKFLLAILFLLFIFPSVFGSPFSFDFEIREDPTLLRTVTVNDRIKAFQSLDGNWWVVYLDNADNKVYFEEFNSAFVSLGRVTDNDICFDASFCEDFDATYWVDGTGEEYIRIITLEDDTKPRVTVTDFKISDSSFTEIVQGGDGVSNWQADMPVIDISAHQSGLLLDDEILIAWKRVFTSSIFSYSNGNLIGAGLGGDGELSISIILEEADQDDLQVAWCNQHYYIGYFDDSADSLFIHAYELNVLGEPEFIGQEDGFTSAGGTVMSIDDWSFFTETTESGTDILHMVALDTTAKDVFFYAWECEDSGRLSNIHTIINDYSDLLTDSYNYTANNITLKYDMDDLASPITDSSGNNLITGTYNGALFSQHGVFDNSLGFDGIDDNIENDNGTLTIIDDNITIGGWFDFHDNTGVQHLIDKHSAVSGYQLWYDEGVFSFSIDTLTSAPTFAYTPDVHAWVFVVGVYNGTHEILYINGTEVDTNAETGNIGSSAPDLHIGSSDTDTNFFTGNIDQLFIFEEALSPSNITDLYNFFSSSDMFSKAFLTKDSNDVFRAFFQFKDPISGIRSIRTVGNFGDCSCNDFVAQNICEYDRQKFERFCAPVGCETNISFWQETTFCQIQFNESQGIIPQKYEWESVDSSCLSEWVNVGQEARCIPEPIRISINCQNITGLEVTVPEFDGTPDKGGNFTLQACTPSIDCDEQEVSCEDIFNDTLNYLIDIETSFYQAGDIMTGLSTLKADFGCRDKGWLDFSGFKQYRVAGAMSYACQVACENEWFCLDEQTEGYKRVDCRPVNVTPCTNGCDSDTGRCKPDTTPSGAVDDDKSPLSASFWNRIFTGDLSTLEKLIIVLLVSAFSGGMLSALLGNTFLKDHVIVIFVIGFFAGLIVFTVMEWISIIWVIVFGLAIIGVLMMRQMN